MHHTRALLEETRETDDGGRRFRFRVATSDVVRDGSTIPADQWKIENYLRNPVVLASHNRFAFPIGRSVTVERDETGLVAEIEFDSNDPLGMDAIRKIDGGFLRATSVGFDPGDIKWPDHPGQPVIFRDVELLEISLVSVPADPSTLLMRGLADGIPPDRLRDMLGIPQPPPESPDPGLDAMVRELMDRVTTLEAALDDAVGRSSEPPSEPPAPEPEFTFDLTRFAALEEFAHHV